MRYHVTIAGRTLEVELEGERPTIDGRTVEADLAAGPDGVVFSLLLDGCSHALIARREAGDRWRIEVDGVPYTAEAVDERTRAIRAMIGGDARARGPRPVRAPMPGLVVRIEVEPGDVVRAGQGVVIVEAMKMENELKAETAGRVTRIHVEPGEAVEKGVVLVELEALSHASEGA